MWCWQRFAAASLLASFIAALLIFRESIQFHLQSIQRPNHLHDTCIMTRVKNGHHLLPQWIEYHFLSGIDHFFISNDCSEDPRTIYWLEQYEAMGIVNVSYNQSFNDCRSNLPNEALHFSYLFGLAKASCRWIAVVDLDEYIFPTRRQKALSFIKEVLLHHEIPLVRMPWIYMSHMGYQTYPTQLIIDAYNQSSGL